MTGCATYNPCKAPTPHLSEDKPDQEKQGVKPVHHDRYIVESGALVPDAQLIDYSPSKVKHCDPKAEPNSHSKVSCHIDRVGDGLVW